MSSPRQQGALVVAVALAARLAVVAWAGARFPAAHDGVRYDALAARLAAGLGYTWAWPDGTVTTVAHYPVGYPALLALAYRLFGHSVVVAGLENACVGALAALAAYGLGRAVATPGVALACGLAVALHPGLVLYTPGIMTEGLTAALIAAATWIAVDGGGRGTVGRSAWLGAVVGLAGLVRPQTLLLAPFFGLLAAGRRGAAASVVVAALVCAPWVARNCGAVGRCTLSTNSGWNLLIGAQPGATGAWQAVSVSGACKDVFGEATTDACFGREAVQAIEDAPLRWLALAPRKLAATFDYGGIGGYYLYLSNPAAFPWRAVLGAGAVETVIERLATVLCLLGCAQIEGPRRRVRAALAMVGGVFCLLPWGWVGVVALCAALACLGRDALARRPLHAATLFVLGSTAAVHAVFFGAPRYALLAAPLVTTLAVVSLADWLARRKQLRADRAPLSGRPAPDPGTTEEAMPSEPRSIPPPPPSKRTLSTERNFFRDLVEDLTLRIEWLEQVIESVPDSGALTQLRGWAKALRELHTSIGHVQAHLADLRFARLFVIEGPLAAYLSRLFGWCEEITTDFEALAVKLRKGEPVLAVFSHHVVNDSFEHFHELGETLRQAIAESRPGTPELQAAWQTFDTDFEELLWATEWLHMSLASKPGG